MKKIKLNISQKLSINNFSLVFFVCGIAIFTIYALNSAKKINNEISNVYQPLTLSLKTITSNLEESNQKLDLWINNPSQEVKDEYFALSKSIKENLKAISAQNTQDDEVLNTIITDIKKATLLQRNITDTLENFQDYFTNIDAAKTIQKDLTELSSTIAKNTDKKITMVNGQIISGQNAMNSSFSLIQILFYFLIIIALLISSVSFYVTYNNIVKPISYLKDIVNSLAIGKLIHMKNSTNDDEVGQMSVSIENLINGLEKTSEFAQEIGKGNLNSEFTPLSNEDTLGNSLLSMRENLVKFNEQERKLNWATEGMAKFSNILRDNNDNLTNLCQQVITNLVKYTESNQGGIFVVQKRGNTEVLNLEAFYAFDRNKFPNKEIHLGEGLVGQCWQEKETIYLTEIPNTFMEVKSGLGGHSPNCVAIVPLIVNQEIYGIIEIASFNILEQHVIDFLEKIGESIASTLSTVQVNIRTKKLLEESKTMAEQLQSQEEELRQNTEEMLATQEELQRKISILESKLNEHKTH